MNASPLLIIAVSELAHEVAISLYRARIAGVWREKALQEFVQGWFGDLGPFVRAEVVSRNPMDGRLGEYLVVSMNTTAATDGDDVAEILFGRGLEHAAGKDLSGALPYFEQAAGLAPKNGYYARALGQAYLELGKQDDAERQLLRAAELLGGDSDTELLLGNLCYARARYFEAERHYRHAISYGRSPEALTNLGAVIGNRGDLSEAAQLFEAALALDPTYERARLGLSISRSKAADESGSGA